MTRLGLYLLSTTLLVSVYALPAYSQEPESLMDVLAKATQLNADEQRNGLVSFLENQISTPDRQFRLSGIEGVLSSDAAIGQITISDTQGIWFIIENAKINWNQAALLFGKLEIRSLKADSITYLRNPTNTEDAPPPSPEATGFSVPELPVGVNIGEISVPLVRFGEDVFGLGSTVSVTGALKLEGGAIDTDLDITRLDGPGGKLLLDVAYENATENVDINIKLDEPKDGIIATLLNVEGKPEVSLAVQGSGLLSELGVDLTFDADRQRILTGKGRVTTTSRGMGIDADLGGPIAKILPEIYADFFGADTSIDVNVVLENAGGITLEKLDISGGELALSAIAGTTQDGFLNRLSVNGVIKSADGTPVILPIAGANTRIDDAKFIVSFGDQNTETWASTFEINGLETADFTSTKTYFNANGVASNLDNAQNRRITFNGDGALDGIKASSPEISEALGTSIGLGIAGLWQADMPLQLAQLRVMGRSLEVNVYGEIEDAIFDGNIAVSSQSIAPLSSIAGTKLAGGLDFVAAGKISALNGGFDLNLTGKGQNIAISNETIDPILAGEINLTGRVARTETGFNVSALRLGNANFGVDADGVYASDKTDFSFNAALADVGMLVAEATGAVNFTGKAQGTNGRTNISGEIAYPTGIVSERQVQDLSLAVNGVMQGADFVGTVAGNGFLGGNKVTLSSEIQNSAEALIIPAFMFQTTGTSLDGNVKRLANGLMSGNIALRAPNIETAAALAFLKAQGAVNADITLTHDGKQQHVGVNGDVNALNINDITVGTAKINATIDDALGVPVIDGNIDAQKIVAAGLDIVSLGMTANSQGETTQFAGKTTLAGNTNIETSGALSPIDGGYRVGVNTFNLAQGALSARLAKPTELMVQGETVQFSGVDLSVGSGRITATGTAGQDLDITLNIAELPLNIANAIVPSLGVSGTISGNAKVSGKAGDPRVSFDARGAGLNAASIVDLGIAPFAVNVAGDYASGAVSISNMTANGQSGLNARVNGRIPLEGNGLDVNAEGVIPLSLANRFLADRGSQVSGTATVNARATGSIMNPSLNGTINIANGDFIDPDLALRLQAITGSANLTGDRLTINSLTARVATGGSVSASGFVMLDAPNFTSDIRINLNDARYADGNLVVATVKGQLALTGPIARGGKLAGNIDVVRADITVPEGFAGGDALIDVEHRNTPRSVAQTLERAKVTERAQGVSSGAKQSAIALDITVNAPNQMFIRGLGLDAEVGGTLRIGGDANNIMPVGGFDLIRGRLSILGQRIDFNSGNVTLIGDMDPFIDLVAQTQGDDITVFVTVKGRASAPVIAFSSQPELPQDEVLAQLIFNRGVGELSPLQLAQLAAAAAELAGGGGGGSIMDGFRNATGLDDLDITTDASGNAALKAGRYLTENIYVGVQAGAGGESKVTIDMDLTEHLTARGATGSDGNTTVGVFYEQDY